MIAKPPYASGKNVIDVQCDQDDPDNKNGQNDVIKCNSGQFEKLENEKNSIARIGIF